MALACIGCEGAHTLSAHICLVLRRMRHMRELQRFCQSRSREMFVVVLPTDHGWTPQTSSLALRVGAEMFESVCM